MLKDIDQHIAVALEMVRTHPDHWLLPIHRRALYDALDPVKSISAQKLVRPWLDLFTTQYVLPLWQPIFQDPMAGWEEEKDAPLQMVLFLEGLLRGTVDRNAVEEQAADWLELSDLSGELPDSQYYLAFCVFDAALTALWGGLGFDFFAKAQITDSTTEITDRYSDTANWAAIASAGGIWEPDFTKAKTYGRVEGSWNRDLDEVRTKRQQFWNWWLLEALPKAVEQGRRHQ